MIVFILVFFATFIYFIRLIHDQHLSNDKNKVEPCKIHKWITINNIMFCEVCKHAPKLKEWYGDSE